MGRQERLSSLELQNADLRQRIVDLERSLEQAQYHGWSCQLVAIVLLDRAAAATGHTTISNTELQRVVDEEWGLENAIMPDGETRFVRIVKDGATT